MRAIVLKRGQRDPRRNPKAGDLLQEGCFLAREVLSADSRLAGFRFVTWQRPWKKSGKPQTCILETWRDWASRRGIRVLKARPEPKRISQREEVKRLSAHAVDLLFADVLDRQGIKQQFGACDDDVNREIRRAWQRIVGDALRRVLK